MGEPQRKTTQSDVVIELFGIPRHRAGVAQVEVPAVTVAEALAALQERCPALRGLVKADGTPGSEYLLSIDGRTFVTDPQRALTPGCRLLLLSADAGG